MEHFGGASAHVGGYGEIGPEGGAGEEASEDGIEAGGFQEGLAGEIRRDDT